jgi:hypothetical protein
MFLRTSNSQKKTISSRYKKYDMGSFEVRQELMNEYKQMLKENYYS